MCEGCITSGRVPRWLAEVIDAFCERYDDVEYGFGHIVLDDWNLEDHHIEWCLQEAVRDEPIYDQQVAEFLGWLLTVPEEERCPQGDAENV